MEAVYTTILDDIIDTQEASGLVPTMAPLMRYMCGPMHDTITWGCAVCLIPELIKRYYGSTAVFAKIYKPCVDYMEYMKLKERDGGLIEHGLGDWGRDIAFGNHQANIETAVYYKCLRNVALMAKELGNAHDEARFTSWADRIYQVRGFDVSVVSFIDAGEGWIVVDPLTTVEVARAAAAKTSSCRRASATSSSRRRLRSSSLSARRCRVSRKWIGISGRFVPRDSCCSFLHPNDS